MHLYKRRKEKYRQVSSYLDTKTENMPELKFIDHFVLREIDVVTCPPLLLLAPRLSQWLWRNIPMLF